MLYSTQRYRRFFRLIAFIIIQAFLFTDFAWACEGDLTWKKKLLQIHSLRRNLILGKILFRLILIRSHC
ncbi:MAG: hypothetical protein DRP78_06090 [Candidatus Omnitrophota bacterium]|nr:MAG: hypothetical protein DRP78_06090 [Candidatus Omnitrophota bacterium]